MRLYLVLAYKRGPPPQQWGYDCTPTATLLCRPPVMGCMGQNGMSGGRCEDARVGSNGKNVGDKNQLNWESLGRVAPPMKRRL